MISRSCREELRRERKHSLKRYEKHRRRNLLAKTGEHSFVMVLDHLKTSFNVPKIFRSAEAFGAHEIHLIGIGPFDPAPAKGSFKHVPARFHENFDDCYRALSERGYTLFTLEPECGKSLPEIELPEKSAFILGHEEIGISFEREEYPDIRCMHIPQFGCTESLNVSIAASIVMYEYVRRLPEQQEG